MTKLVDFFSKMRKYGSRRGTFYTRQDDGSIRIQIMYTATNLVVVVTEVDERLEHVFSEYLRPDDRDDILQDVFMDEHLVSKWYATCTEFPIEVARGIFELDHNAKLVAEHVAWLSDHIVNFCIDIDEVDMDQIKEALADPQTGDSLRKWYYSNHDESNHEPFRFISEGGSIFVPAKLVWGIVREGSEMASKVVSKMGVYGSHNVDIPIRELAEGLTRFEAGWLRRTHGDILSNDTCDCLYAVEHAEFPRKITREEEYYTKPMDWLGIQKDSALV